MPPKSSDSATSQVLGAREQGVFKQLVRLYETKQYKKALKAADAILKKAATHGETLAMKGLVYNQMKRRDEAHQLVKRGLEANFNSHVCWHVYGLIYRAENKYEQAIKCFDERTQLLAFDGRRFAWMALDDILRAESEQQRRTRRQPQRHCQLQSACRHVPAVRPPLLVASYNPASEQLEYHPLSHPTLLKSGQHAMVDVKQSAAQQGGVQLSVTADHTLFVRMGCAGGTGSDGGVEQYAAHFSRVEAGQLLSQPGPRRVRLLAAAAKGVNTINLLKHSSGQSDYHLTLLSLVLHQPSAALLLLAIASHDPPAARPPRAVLCFVSAAPLCAGAECALPLPPFVIELRLNERDEQLAFCALYGLWLGAGSITRAGHLRLSACSDADIALLDGLFHRLSRTLRSGAERCWFKSHCDGVAEQQQMEDKDSNNSVAIPETDDASLAALGSAATSARSADEAHSASLPDRPCGRPICEYIIVAPRWCRYFAEQCEQSDCDGTARCVSLPYEGRTETERQHTATGSAHPSRLSASASFSTTSTDSDCDAPPVEEEEAAEVGVKVICADGDGYSHCDDESETSKDAAVREAQSAHGCWWRRDASSAQWLGSWVLECCDDRELLRAIIAGYQQVSGAVTVDGRQQLLLTDSARLRDELLLLCLHAGFSAHFSLERPAGKMHSTDSSSAQSAALWSVSYSGDAAWVEPELQVDRDVGRSTLSGSVWCVTVPPHHLVLARTILQRDPSTGAVVSASRPVLVGQCYQNALKKDPQNVQILKDLSQLQVQRRMADGYCETRRQLLMLKTNNRGNWLAYAIGHHLAGRHNKAVDIIDSFMRTQDTEDELARRKKRAKEREEAAAQLHSRSADELRAEVDRDMAAFNARSRVRLSFEDSELHLYRLSLLTESRQWQAALDYLDDVQVHLVDSLSYLESRAMLLLELGRVVEAEQCYRGLLAINADNAAYHRGLHRSLALSANSRDDSERLRALYAELQTEYPKSSLVRRLPLDFCHDSTFASLVAAHMKHFIRRAIPSLFADMRPLYLDQRKVQQIQAIVEAFIAALQTTQRFDDEDGQERREEESPSCLLWTLFFAAQHYDHLGLYPRALSLVSAAISHTPTTVDAYLLQARILKHAGDAEGAFAAMDACRALDTADRYLNTKCVRYALRAGREKEADELVGLFLRDDADGLRALNELQVMWWEFQFGLMCERRGEISRALKSFHFTHKHFTDIYEDQFDFHTYSVRKGVLRAYLDMLRWEDGLHAHKFFVRACLAIVRCYLALHDQAVDRERRQLELDNDQTMTDEERKALAKRQKKAAGKEKKKQLAAEEDKKAHDDLMRKSAAASAAKSNKAGGTAPPDLDPNGAHYLTLDPLKEATHFVQILHTHAPQHSTTWQYSLQLARRKRRWLQVWRAVRKANQLQAADPEAHYELMAAIVDMQREWDSVSELVRQLVQEEWADDGRAGDIRHADVAAINTRYLQQHMDSIPHRYAVSRVLLLVSPSALRAEAVQLLRLTVDVGDGQSPPVVQCPLPSPASRVGVFSLSVAERISSFLSGLDGAAGAEWSQAVRPLFPLSRAFGLQVSHANGIDTVLETAADGGSMQQQQQQQANGFVHTS